jgi:hypothetical protein
MMCRKPGCEFVASPGYAYCCREHAPFGHLVGEKRERPEKKRGPSIAGRVRAIENRVADLEQMIEKLMSQQVKVVAPEPFVWDGAKIISREEA